MQLISIIEYTRSLDIFYAATFEFRLEFFSVAYLMLLAPLCIDYVIGCLFCEMTWIFHQDNMLIDPLLGTVLNIKIRSSFVNSVSFVPRHLDNLLLRDDGRLFHVDFGFILGRDPKPFPPPMKLCKEMVEAMGGAER